jgi:hypothetical protein
MPKKESFMKENKTHQLFFSLYILLKSNEDLREVLVVIFLSYKKGREYQ